MKSLAYALLIAAFVATASAQFDYSGCGDSKVCFGFTANTTENSCIDTEDCTLVASYVAGAVYAFEMQSTCTLRT